MGRPATGCAQWNPTRKIWIAILTVKGKRLPQDMPGIAEHEESRAKALAAVLSKRARERGAIIADEPAEDMTAWLGRWIADRVAKGNTSTREDLSHYVHHIGPAIGAKHVAIWTGDDLRGLSRALDEKIRKNEIAWKTAGNIWVTAGKMLADAVKSKRDDIRCRKDNPIRDVEGPDRGHSRARAYLYPSELVTFVTCPEVPLRWRVAVAIAVYTYARAAELRALKWEDVDLEHGTIHIHRARDRVTGEDKTTKGKRARRFTLEPTILPVLQALYDASAGEGHVLSLPSDRDLSRGLKRWLWKADLRRAELHTSDGTRQALRFHDLRATGITWMAVRGDAPQQIMHRAGHTDFATTQLYIREAEQIREGFGEVFPSLPGFVGVSSFRRNSQARSQGKDGGFWRGGRDSNPRPPA